MNRETFWRIVDKGKAHDEPEENLRAALSRVTPEDVAAFDVIFRRMLGEAFTWDLWGAAYLLLGGCSADGFVYFRCGLIARGRSVFEGALRNPDSLAMLEGDAESLENEAFGYVANEVYEEKTGRSLNHQVPARLTPSGRKWNFDDDRVARRRLPRLYLRTARDRFDALLNEGWEKDQVGDKAGAIACYRAALALLPPDDPHPGIPVAHSNLVANEGALGAIKRARLHLEHALRTRTNLAKFVRDRADLDNRLAWFIFEHGPKERLSEALSWARAAVRKSSHPLKVMDTEMRILLRLGRDDEARRVAQRALTQDPRHPDFQDVKARFGLDSPQPSSPSRKKVKAKAHAKTKRRARVA